jgi:hypothetical protein
LLRVSGVSFEALAKEFAISKDSIFRHFKSHVSERRKAELLAGPAKIHDLANAAAAESKSLLEYLSITRGILFNRFLFAAECGDTNGVVSTATQLLAALRELGKLSGELRNLSGINITQNNILVASPEFERLSTGLLALAQRHPAARQDVVDLLRALEGPGPSSPYSVSPMIEGDAIIEELADAQ